MGRTFNKHEAVLYTRHRNLVDPAQLSILEACLCLSPPNESNPRLLFGIANATQCRGYILKRALPDNSLGISSARILARLSSRRGKDRWVGALDWSAGLVEKKKKKLVSRFYARLVSYGKREQRRAMILLYSSLLHSARWGRASMERLAILLLVLVPLFARGREGDWVIVADTVSLFRYGVFFWQKCCCNGRSAAVFGMLYTG